MNDYTKELGFWQRLESFIKDVQTNCCIGEEEKDMILYNCKLKILDLQHVSKCVEPVRKPTVCGFIQGSCRYEDNVGYCQAPPHIKCEYKQTVC